MDTLINRMGAASPRLLVVPPDPPAALGIVRVFHEHHAFVCRLLRHLGLGVADVEDLAQEVFVVVHR